MTNEPDLMQIKSPCVVTLTWSLKDSLNQDIEQLDTPTPYLYGGSDLLPKVEEALLNHTKGEQLDLYLEPEHAFGEYISDLVFFENRNLFPDIVAPGLQFEGLPRGAQSNAPDDVIFTVTEVYAQHVVVDGNHPLAGISLRLHIDILDVREATPEELEQATTSTSMFEVMTPPSSANKVLH